MVKIITDIKPLTIEGKEYYQHKLYVYEGSDLYSVLKEYEYKSRKGLSVEIGALNSLLIKLNRHYSLNLDLYPFKYTSVNVGITIEDSPTTSEERVFKIFDGIVDCDKKKYNDLKELLIHIETLLSVLDTDTIQKVLIE